MQCSCVLALCTLSICIFIGQVDSTSENCEWMTKPPKFDKPSIKSSARSPPKDDEQRLVMFDMEQGPKWMTRKELKEIHAKGGLINYIDLTDSAPLKEKKSGGVSSFELPTITLPPIAGIHGARYPIPDKVRFADKVKPMLDKIDADCLKKFVTKLSAFPSRYGENKTDGPPVIEWLENELRFMLKGYAGPCQTVVSWAHASSYPGEYGLPLPMHSLIVRLLGSDPELKREVVVLGAHIDATNWFNTSTGTTPGADDNGSGSSVLFETLRVLLETKFVPRRSLEFHWYAYEENGLVGSKQISENYIRSNINVVGLLNLDVVGYAPPNKPDLRKLGINHRNTHHALNQFLYKLAEKFVDIPTVHNDVCFYCSSDHFTWIRATYPAAFVHEVMITPFLHTGLDTIDTVNFQYVKEFAKLALAFIVEYGEPQS